MTTPDLNRIVIAVVATGPSMSSSLARKLGNFYGGVNYACGIGRCLVVSDAYKDCPNADVLVSSDVKWWRYHKPEFEGCKVMGNQGHARYGEEWMPQQVNCHNKSPAPNHLPVIPSDVCSGALAIYVAACWYADLNKKVDILLFGYDMKPGGSASHYFGEHPAPLTNTPDFLFEKQRREVFQAVAHAGTLNARVHCCTPGSGLLDPELNNGAALPYVDHPMVRGDGDCDGA